MSTFKVRVYSTYYDEYQVEAGDAEAAEALVHAYTTDTDACVLCEDHVGDDVSDIMTEELDDGGEIVSESHTYCNP